MKQLETAGERHLYLPLRNNIPHVSLISDLSYNFFFLASENILILLTKENGVYSALVKIHLLMFEINLPLRTLKKADRAVWNAKDHSCS